MTSTENIFMRTRSPTTDASIKQFTVYCSRPDLRRRQIAKVRRELLYVSLLPTSMNSVTPLPQQRSPGQGGAGVCWRAAERGRRQMRRSRLICMS